jgi:hypothetical protein
MGEVSYKGNVSRGWDDPVKSSRHKSMDDATMLALFMVCNVGPAESESARSDGQAVEILNST